MKKKYLILFALVIVFVVGCGKKVKIGDNWVLNMEEVEVTLDSDIKKSFDDALENHNNKDLKPVALLGKQVVAGTNYMFLCNDGDDGYKIVIIYKDLSGKVTITNVSTFDILEYVNKNIELNTEVLSGGWYTEVPSHLPKLDEEMELIFNDATGKMVGARYTPIKVLGTKEQGKKETNYAIICYGVLSDANQSTGVFLLNIHNNESTSDITSIAAIDLAEYNQ